MVGLFRRWSQDRVFAITTHSPIFLDSGGEAAHIHVLSRSNGESQVKPADANLIDVLEALGVRPSDVLSADRLLLVEGPSDRDVLAAWWPALIEDPTIAIITGQGGRNARFAGLLSQWINAADRLNRRILYVRDRDELAGEQARRLNNDPNVHLLYRREIENYLLDPEALADFFAGHGCTTSSPDVERAMREAADELKLMVIIKSVAGRLGSVRLVDDVMRRAMSKSAQNVDDMIQVIVHRIPLREDVEQEIRILWSEIESDITSKWESDWQALAPGEEVLHRIFKEFLGRGHKKTGDAGHLARLMKSPPSEILEVVQKFVPLDLSRS